MRQDLLPSVELLRLGRLPDDCDRTYRWRNDRAIYQWCRQADVLHEHSHQRWFIDQSNNKSLSMYGIYVTSDDIPERLCLVGVCGLTSIDHLNRRAEFSLYIGPGFHHHGYGEAALRELIKKGFLNYGLNSIWGETFEGNPAMKMFERVGFKKEGTRREFYMREGKFIDCHLVSILRSEYDLANNQRAA